MWHMKATFGLFLLTLPFLLQAQATKRALFIGNSYTYYNSLPEIVSDIAHSAGDTLIVFSSTPGGYTLANHLSNTATMNYIAQGGWDFVVLQEQSQMPAFPLAQVEAETFPYAAQLNDSILYHNPCAETVLYMTWGRQNGDSQNCANWPPVCTYEGMDDLLQERYMMMADLNEALVSPVSAVWRNVRELHPDIQLYASDGSHPSPTGSYLAAMCFYTTFFRKSPLNTNYSYTIADSTANMITQTVDEIVFQHLNDWYIGAYDPQASGELTWTNANDLQLTNTSANATESYYALDGGDFTAMFNDNVSITVSELGTHTITLIAAHCEIADTAFITFDIASSISESALQDAISIFPNPTHGNTCIVIPEGFHQSEISIFQSTGKIILQKTQLCNRQHYIDCNSWPAGVYTVRISNAFHTVFKRLVIE